MFGSLDECGKAWKIAGKHGDGEERIARNERWIQYYSSLASYQGDGEFDIDNDAAEIVNYLRDINVLHDHSTLLDIGSGTGAYALPFAKCCACVTALDMDSASMISLEKRAEKLGLRNIACITEMWERYTPNRRFSVVFSAMCPAICNYDELLKMESMAEETCCIIAVARGSYELHRGNLMRLMDIKPEGGMTTEALWYYEMLYLMGRQPDVKSWTNRREYTLSLEEVCRRNEKYFAIFGISAEKSRPLLRAYFEAQAVGDAVHDVRHLNLALITWKVPKR